MYIADFGQPATGATCVFDYKDAFDFVQNPVSLSVKTNHNLVSLYDEDCSGALRISTSDEPSEIFVPSSEASRQLVRQVAQLARQQPNDYDEYTPPPARPQTVNEAKWVVMQISHLPRPTIQLLDAGEIVFSWVRSNVIADLQFDGSGVFCAYVGDRPNKTRLRSKYDVTSPAVKSELIALLETVLNDSREKT